MQHIISKVAFGKRQGSSADDKEVGMLRLTVSTEEYLMIGEDIRLVFLGGTGKHLRIMVDAPKDKNIVRSTVLERNITDPEERAKLPRYYAEEEHPEKYVRKAEKDMKAKACKSSEAAENISPEKEGNGAVKKSRIIIARGNVKGGSR